MIRWFKRSPYLMTAVVLSVAVLAFGTLFTRTAPGCCEVGKVVSVGFPFAYKSTSYELFTNEVSTDGYDQDGLFLNIVAWTVVIASIGTIALIAKYEMGKNDV